jgi:hypothetical protein
MRTSPPSGEVVTYVFLLEGGTLDEDWELNVLLPAHFGKEEADRLISDWVETFAPLESWADAALASGRDSGQVAYTLEPVPLA